jgi:hypothetical protein
MTNNSRSEDSGFGQTTSSSFSFARIGNT